MIPPQILQWQSTVTQRKRLVPGLLLACAILSPRGVSLLSARPDVDAWAEQTSTAKAPLHALRGVVKAVSGTSMTVTRSARHPGDVVFVLNAATVRAAEIAPGAVVSVRYQIVGATFVATAVAVRAPARRPAGASSAP